MGPTGRAVIVGPKHQHMIWLTQLPMKGKASERLNEIPIHDASHARKGLEYEFQELWHRLNMVEEALPQNVNQAQEPGSRTNFKGSDRGSKDPGTPTEDCRNGEGEKSMQEISCRTKRIELGCWLGPIDIDPDGWRTASKGDQRSTKTTSKYSKTPLKKPVSTFKDCLQLSKRKERRVQHLCRMQVIMRYARHCLPPSIWLHRRGVAPIGRFKNTFSRNKEQRSSIISSWRTK